MLLNVTETTCADLRLLTCHFETIHFCLHRPQTYAPGIQDTGKATVLVSRAMSDSSLNEIKVPSWIRGCHAYKDYQEIEIEEVLGLQHEPKNQHDKNAVVVIRDGHAVGHIPRALASTNQGTGIVQHFLTKTGSKADVEVVGKAVNRGGGYGMEVPCVLPYLRRGSTVVNI